MITRFNTIIFLICFLALSSLSQETRQKAIEQLIDNLKSENRELSDSAIDELVLQKEKSLPAVTSLAANLSVNHIIRARAILVLGKIGDKSSAPVLIKLLKDKEPYIRGTSSYSLSLIGGKPARRALLKFLENCLEKDYANLPRVTEAFVILPDARAFPLLMKIVEIGLKQMSAPVSRNTEKDKVKNSTLPNAVKALGEIGDSRASEPIAKLLDPTVNYVHSRDYFYLESISKTKGKAALPYLISYLEKLVERMKGQISDDVRYTGIGNRSNHHNALVYRKTVNCLETITGKQSEGATREEVLMFWQKYLNVSS